jgi:hypothetical protein
MTQRNGQEVSKKGQNECCFVVVAAAVVVST